MSELKSNYSVLRRMKKSQSQQYLNRKRGAFTKRHKIPTIEERNSGGIYASIINKRRKIDPFDFQMKYLSSGYIHTHGTQDVPITKRDNPMFNLQKPNLENLQHVRKQFVERGLRNKLNPITNQYSTVEQKVSQKYKKRNEELESLMKTLEPPKVHDNLEISSTASDAKQKDLKEVDPEYYNLLHQNDGQNDQHRYISESKSMGLDVKAKNQPQTTKSVTRKPVINKKYKSKNSAVAVFPSYGVSVEKSPF